MRLCYKQQIESFGKKVLKIADILFLFCLYTTAVAVVYKACNQFGAVGHLGTIVSGYWQSLLKG